MTEYKQLLRDLQNQIYHPLYLLHGEEPYYIDRISDYIERHVLSEAEKSFNQTIIYGKDTGYKDLLDIVMRYPMMSNYQVVILKEAQQFRDFDALLRYFEHPMRSTIFVICYKYKKFDGRSKAYKLLSTKGVTLESKKLYDNQIPAFIDSLAKEMEIHLSHDATELLTEYLGNNLSKIMNELEKLSLNVGKGTTVSTHHIEKYIGISKDYNVFELTKALALRNKPRTFRIVKYFEKNPKANEPVMVMGMLYSFFSKALVLQSTKANPYEMMGDLQIRSKPMADDLKNYLRNYSSKETVNILHLLHEYDMKVKGVDFSGTEKSVLLTDLMFRILIRI
ncbi:MAG TPA: DNA polymerase III subunit delta [Chitinophagales bacterium]|nr:DNA polymerase III subunit delta [Chitinophagales bacterium]